MNSIILMHKNPNNLYTYWTFDDNLCENFDNRNFGFSWNESRLALKVINLSLKTSFFASINDLTAQWYIDIKHPNSSYKVEIGRLFNDNFIKFCESNECYVPTNSYIYDSNKDITFKNINLL